MTFRSLKTYHRATISLGRQFTVALTFEMHYLYKTHDIEGCYNEHGSLDSTSFITDNFTKITFFYLSLYRLDFTVCIFDKIWGAIKQCHMSTPVSKGSISLFRVYIQFFSLSDVSLMQNASAHDTIYYIGPCKIILGALFLYL